MSDLKPCPFCGAGEPMVMGPTCKRSDPYNPADRLFPTVRCRRCYAEATGNDDDTSCSSAVERWNRRTPQPVTPAGGEVVTWHAFPDELSSSDTVTMYRAPCESMCLLTGKTQNTVPVITHPPVADAALPRGHRVDDGKQLAMIRDADRLDWLEQVAFTTYRTRDPETGRLYSHVTFVNEDEAPRRGITRDSFREAIDAAMSEDAALNQRGGGDHG